MKKFMLTVVAGAVMVLLLSCGGSGSDKPGPGTDNGGQPDTGAKSKCQVCSESSCSSDVDSCQSNSACSALGSCIGNCSSNSCASNCIDQNRDGYGDFMLVNLCIEKKCATDCSINLSACSGCMIDNCYSSARTCYSSSSCSRLALCISDCSSDSCAQDCLNTYSSGVTALKGFAQCLNDNCKSQCQ